MRAHSTFNKARRRKREAALRDKLVRPLLKRLLVGPKDPVLYRNVVHAAHLMLLGLDLLGEVTANAYIPPTCILDHPRGRRTCRPGDRLQWNSEVIWTELSDGAAWEAEMFLEGDYMAELRSDLRRLTAAGLAAEGKSEIFMLLEDLPPEMRALLDAATARPPRTVQSAEIDQKVLEKVARRLRELARAIHPENKEAARR
jgi:hypothetical protein